MSGLLPQTGVYRNMLLLSEHKHVLECKEEPEDLAVCKPDEGSDGGSPGASETGKRSSSETGSDGSRSKRLKVSGEVRHQLGGLEGSVWWPLVRGQPLRTASF